MKEIKLSSVSIPGWIWVAGILLIEYLVHRYVTDSLIVEGVTVVGFMIMKRFDIMPSDVKQLTGIITDLADQLDILKGSVPSKSSSYPLPRPTIPSEEVMRGGHSIPIIAKETPRPIITMNRGVRWMLG